jgi:hypothetical protein
MLTANMAQFAVFFLLHAYVLKAKALRTNLEKIANGALTVLNLTAFFMCGKALNERSTLLKLAPGPQSIE